MSSGCDFDVLDLAGGRGNGQAFLLQPFDMEGDGIPDFALHILLRGTRRHTTREIGHVG